MKNLILKLILPVFAIFLIASCAEEEFVQYETGLTQKITDASLQIETQVVSFQGGTPNYDLKFALINGVRKVTKVNVYSVFTDAKTKLVSGKVLLKSYNVGNDAKTNFSEKLTYADLKNGITIGGAPLPADDKALAVGSGWKLSFEGETAQGPVNLPGNVNVGVLSIYAGIYTVIESKYYRINVLTADWSGEERFIGSVDETTFSHPDYWGNFPWAGKSFNFKVDFSNNSIQVPVLVDGAIFSGLFASDCINFPDAFANVPCAGSNVLIPDPVGGKHIIKLTYGYTSANGEREFYEVLQKK
ncbi:MAG: hypothetical protein IPL08_16915 [Saprospiraceae bacterium]|nr:hypothetical protein [Saprospiraceae bacterium]MBL0100926.1 hypothetical protein [Saprospiraceae bacterium]